jgi:hypothetical protein
LTKRQKLIAILKTAVLDSQTYFDLPVYVTETSDGVTDEAEIACIHGLYLQHGEVGCRWRVQSGFPVARCPASLALLDVVH